MGPATRVIAADAPDQARRAELIPRPRLTEVLLGSSDAPLVLLKAPAGCSKTTTLAEWDRADPRPFAWVSMEGRHDDPVMLVTAIVEALDEVEPAAAEVLLALTGPAPDLEGTVLPKLAACLRGRRPFVLVLDDVHSIDSPSSFEVLRVAIAAMPEGAQVALASRSEPPLRLGRLRAERRLVELGTDDLAMDASESAKLLRAVGLELSGEQERTLFERTEGWPAALYLAGLALRGREDLAAAVAEFAGDDRILADYVRDEFLAATDAETLDFLVRSSVLSELTGSACDAVLQREGSGELLRRLSRSNALVVRLDRRDERYRYHHLFGELLLSELRRRRPRLEAELHARAAAHFEVNGEPARAIDHALAAGETARAGATMVRIFPELLGRGHRATVSGWLQRAGEAEVSRSPSLAIVASHVGLAQGDGERAAAYRRLAEAAAGGEAEHEGDLVLIDATLARHGVERMGADAARVLELHTEDSAWRAAASLYLGVSRHLLGDPDAAKPELREAVRSGALWTPLIQVVALAQLALLAYEEAKPDEGARLLGQAREQVSRCGLGELPSVALVSAVSGMAFALEGSVERAWIEYRRAERLRRPIAGFIPWYEAELAIVLARIATRLDDRERAEALNDEAAGLLDAIGDATLLEAWLERSRAAAAGLRRRSEGGGTGLSPAELRTLQYLPTQLSFREIGERIHVSQNTVKTQAQAIYRKLGVGSRTDAVERAREAGLLAAERQPG